MNRLGAVVIGRNEGTKLRRCLLSVIGNADPIIYVDSGSEDGSVDLARSLGVDVVELDRCEPFTVARGRNAGFARVAQLYPGTELVQFVDADSEMVSTWFATAANALASDRKLAVVFGTIREREPRRSLYTRLYRAEFDPLFNPPDICGGMAMMRLEALQQMQGFNNALRGFEDFELCLRLRRAGWVVTRLDAEMVVHEARMNDFRQWWQRQVRGGYSRGQEASLHAGSEHFSIRPYVSIWFWGVLLPLLSLVPAAPTHGATLLLLAGYPLIFLRIFRRCRLLGIDGALYAASCVLGKFPQMLGLARFHVEQIARRAAPLRTRR